MTSPSKKGHDIDMKKKLFSNVPLIMLNNFNHNKHCLRIKLQFIKIGFSSKFTEKRHNNAYMPSQVKNVTRYINKFFIKKDKKSKCIYDQAEQLLPRETSLENQVKVPKKELSQQITKKGKLTTINDVICQKWDMI